MSNKAQTQIALISLNPNQSYSLVAYTETQIAFIRTMQPYEIVGYRNSKVYEDFTDPFGLPGIRLDFHDRDKELFLEQIKPEAWDSLADHRAIVELLTKHLK